MLGVIAVKETGVQFELRVSSTNHFGHFVPLLPSGRGGHELTPSTSGARVVPWRRRSARPYAPRGPQRSPRRRLLTPCAVGPFRRVLQIVELPSESQARTTTSEVAYRFQEVPKAEGLRVRFLPAGCSAGAAAVG